MTRQLIFSLLLIIPFRVFGQTVSIDTTTSLQKIENKLLTLIDTAELVGHWDTSEIGLETIFIDNLVFVLKSERSFDYPFNRLTSCKDSITKSCIKLIYSNDGRFRIFNWLSSTTGTMHHLPAIIQSKNELSNVLVKSSEENLDKDGDIGGGISFMEIYKIRNTKRQLYIALGAGQASGRLPYETIEIFEVLSNSISDTSSIMLYENKLNSNILIDRESTRYDINPQDIPNIKYDYKNQMIIIPEIAESKRENELTRWNGKLTKLKFDGKVFRKMN